VLGPTLTDGATTAPPEFVRAFGPSLALLIVIEYPA